MEKLKKRKVAADADDVLLDLSPALWEYYNHRFETSLGDRDYIYYDLERVWGVTRQRAVEVVNDFYRSQEFKQMLPTKGAQEAVRILSRGNELSVVTSRPVFIATETIECLLRYFGSVFKEIFYNGQYGMQSSGLDKSEYCLKNGIFVILEDNLDIAKKCAAKGIEVLLFDNLWNKTPAPLDGIIRVGERGNHWEEVLEHLC